MRNLGSLAAVAGALALLAGCTGEPTAPPLQADPGAPGAATQLNPVFEAAGREFEVPVELLKAIGYAETRWEMVTGSVEFEGIPPAFGVMALRGERLEEGAALAGVSAEAVRTEPQANIRAAAALLGAWGREMGIDGAELAAWAPVVARYSGIEQPEYQAHYVHQGVYAALREGAEREAPFSASLSPVQVRPQFLTGELNTLASSMACAPDYCFSGTVWRPSPDYNSRPSGDIGKVHMVIIHTCEGGYSSCINTLINSTRSVSAHYVVNESGSEVSQLVREAHRAWHIGATYYCSNNGGHDCWRDGYSSNHFTIGIEHAGYASQSSFPTGQVDKSAHLSCDISKAYGIPRDRHHYVAHGQLQSNRSDPGPNWPWTDYMNRINSYCGSGTIIIDSNNNNNDTSKGYIEVSGNWTGSSATPGYYGTGYWYASTKPVSDPATFWFYLPAAATKTVDAWWTAGSNRSSTAPFIAWNANGTKLGTAYANQQTNGGKWNALGTYSFSAGWNKIQLSRWTTEGYVVIADAVRIR